MATLSTTKIFGSNSGDIHSWTVHWTVFTPPSSCNYFTTDFHAVVSTLATNSLGSVSPTLKTYRPCQLLGLNHTGCVPYASAASSALFHWHKWQNLSGGHFVATYYSPGFSCPAGWQTAGKFTLPSMKASQANFNPPPAWAQDLLRTGGTHVICCPR